MRHQVKGRKLGRTSSHRKAMLRNMASSLIEHGRIKTTLEKAKELRRFADKLVTISKEDSLHARRKAFDLLRNRAGVQKLFAEIAPSFEARKGGYTRIMKLGHRVGDAAQMAIIEYLQEDLLSAKVEGKVAEKKAAPKKKPAAKKSEETAKEEKKAKTATKAKKADDAEKKPAKKAAAKKTTAKKAAPKKKAAAKKKATDK
ncbi:MAG: 50S ribosomal protein L17 [Deltaproteobacteria bacterium]|nr:50S ribosomal protein L17 [Deltaproteobacteria bacterium]